MTENFNALIYVGNFLTGEYIKKEVPIWEAHSKIDDIVRESGFHPTVWAVVGAYEDEKATDHDFESYMEWYAGTSRAKRKVEGIAKSNHDGACSYFVD